MSALESLIASNGEAAIHPSLDYVLPSPSTAVVDRKQGFRAYPTSASTLSINGVRTVRIRLGGDDFVDPSSIRIMFTINNLDATKKLVPTTGPWGVWQQVYLRSNGVELDNVPYYNRFHTQFGWNQLGRDEQFAEANEGLHTTAPNSFNKPVVGQIEAASSFTCMHKLHLSVPSAGKMLPLRYMPLEFELSLVTSASDWLTTTSNSSDFSISAIQIMADYYTLDESIQQSFFSSLLKNRVLSIPCMNVYQTVQVIPAGSTSYSFSSVRAFSRLSQIWLTFRKYGARSSSFFCPGALPGDADVTNVTLSDTQVPMCRLSIGPQWPSPQPVSTAAEYYMLMQKALGYAPNISRASFEYDGFTIVFDLKRLPSDSTTALPTRSGDLCRFDLTNLTLQTSQVEVWMTMVSFGVCAIREFGISLLT